MFTRQPPFFSQADFTSTYHFSLSLYRCAIDDTVEFIETADERMQRFKLESFSFVGDHPFVYMHCRVKICNATDPNSRCEQGCLHERRKRSLYSQGSNDEEAYLAQGPFMLPDQEANDQETLTGERDVENSGKFQLTKEKTKTT